MTRGVERVVRDAIRAALKSPLFLALQEEGVLLEDHPGGCVLHEKRAEVERLLQAGQPQGKMP